MRLHSTSHSIDALRITALAVLETFVSIAIYGAIALWTNSLTHIAVAVCCAPLFLLRTDYSYRLGIDLFDRYLGRDIDARPDALFFVGLICAPVAGPVIRFFATLIGTFRHPVQTVKEIPKNWYRQCLCTDVAHFPELVPGENNLTSVRFDFRFLVLMPPDVMENLNLFQRIFLVFIRFSLAIFGYIPAMMLRISFKATSVVYLPLIFVAHTTASSQKSLKLRLSHICRGELEKARRYVSLTMLSLAALKLFAFLALVDAKTLDDYTLGAELSQYLLAGGTWPWWQILLIIDATITLAVWFFADQALLNMEFQEGGSEGRDRAILDTLSFLRGVCACATISILVTKAAWFLLGSHLGIHWN